MLTKDHLMSVLDAKKDYYLRFLIRNEGHFFKPEVLLFHREYFKRNKKDMKGAEMSISTNWETHIPCCDEQTISEVKKRINYLIELISACEQLEKKDKQSMAEDELKQLTKYLKANTVINGRIGAFPGNYSRRKATIMKAILRSLEKLKEIDPDLSMAIRQNLISKSEIGISELPECLKNNS